MTPYEQSQQAPDWLAEHCRKARAALGIADFPTKLVMLDVIDNDPETGAEAHTDFRYLKAFILFRRDIEDNPQGHEVGTHESLHVAMFPISAAVTRIIDGMVPKAQRRVAWDLYHDACEQFVVRTARGLTPLLDSVDRVPISEAEPAASETKTETEVKDGD